MKIVWKLAIIVVLLTVPALIVLGKPGTISLVSPRKDSIRGSKFVVVQPAEPEEQSWWCTLLEYSGIVDPAPQEPSPRQRVVIRRGGSTSPRMQAVELH